MKVYKVAVSKEAPNLRDVLWAKPEGNGFSLYLQNNGKWCPLNTGNDNKEALDAVEEAKKKIVGTSKDKKSAMTLYGLKAYINDALSNIG